MKEELKEKVSFDFIRYANCWEDPFILIEALQGIDHKQILSVGSAGDNSFSLLTLNPEKVVCVDVSLPQLYLIELKKLAITNFDREKTIAFLGFTTCENRWKIYLEIQDKLSSEAQLFFEKHRTELEKGIIHQGKFEKYFQYFSAKILPWIHSKKTVEELFKLKTQEEQALFYKNKWNTWRWRLLFKIFFSKYVMGKYGRDPEFLNEVKISVGEFIFKQAAQQLASKKAQENFILRYNLTGNFDSLLPHYLREENYGIIQKNCSKLEIFNGYAQDAGKKYGQFTGMNISNIFEYMPADLFQKTAADLIYLLEQNGKIAYWNLMVPRRISEIFPEKLSYEKEKSLSLKEKDQGFFYNHFIVEYKL